jgi:hypothetical protein
MKVQIGIDDESVVVLEDILSVYDTSELYHLIQITSFNSEKWVKPISQQQTDSILVKNIGLNIFAKPNENLIRK